jgi:hypothetical protein
VPVAVVATLTVAAPAAAGAVVGAAAAAVVGAAAAVVGAAADVVVGAVAGRVAVAAGTVVAALDELDELSLPPQAMLTRTPPTIRALSAILGVPRVIYLYLQGVFTQSYDSNGRVDSSVRPLTVLCITSVGKASLVSEPAECSATLRKRKDEGLTSPRFVCSPSTNRHAEARSI